MTPRRHGDPSAVNGAIAGFRRPEQVDPIVAAANLTLDEHNIATILRRK